MRKPLVAGNWKMYKTVAEARHLVSEMVPGLQAIEGVEKVICPPFTALLAVRALLEGTEIELGAQNLHWETSGAYTGEISPLMISELCQYVIIGHSERRTYFGEVDDTVNRKTQAAMMHGLIPIICVGESLEEYESGMTEEIVDRQIRQGLAKMDLQEKSAQQGQSPLVIAYEPVWAIGTGKAATAEGANAVIANVIRASIAELFGEEFASSTRVLYGGSVKPDNASEFFMQPDIDGALVGGASLNSSDFISITRAAAT
ncbi:MAG: triose-phosphate isomerase [Anaerolineales bacterium]|nr:MAG: triose-phosphate isomerase [Anaerolineales bacterium]